jgi:hypothetical protein
LELIIINFIISHGTKVSNLLDCSLNEIPVDFFLTNCNHMGKFLPCESFKIHFASIFLLTTQPCVTPPCSVENLESCSCSVSKVGPQSHKQDMQQLSDLAV